MLAALKAEEEEEEEEEIQINFTHTPQERHNTIEQEEEHDIEQEEEHDIEQEEEHDIEQAVQSEPTEEAERMLFIIIMNNQLKNVQINSKYSLQPLR